MDTRRCERATHVGQMVAILLVALALIPAWWTIPAAQAQEMLPPEAIQVAQTINSLRAQADLPPLAVHPLLTQAAVAHVTDMVTSGRYSHTGSDGSNVHQRVARTGYQVDGWAGEIWAAYRDVDQAFQMWMQSPPHRDSILSPSYREIGVGVAPHPSGVRLVIVVVFATGSRNQPPGETLPTQPEPMVAASPSVPVTPDTYSQDGRYVVQPGDTLFTIGMRYGVDWQELAAANGLNEDAVLQIGQVLRLPGTNVGEAVSTSAGTVSGSGTEYVVAPGDTLFGIALRHGLTWQELAAANGLSGDALLHVGDRLRIPMRTSPQVHVVQPGDTVMGIAVRYRVDWQAILALNGLREDSLLQVGQVLRLP